MLSDSNESVLSNEDNESSKKRNKKQSIENRTHNKRKRYSGESFTSTSGRKVCGKPFTLVLNCCKNECYKQVNINDQENLFNQFFCDGSKEQQDVLLSCLMSHKSPSTHHVNIQKARNNIWTYSVKIKGLETVVCQKFLRTLYQISEKRLRIIQNKILSGQSFGEKRGSHNNRPRSIDSNIWDLVKEHLSSIPSRESHYSRNKSSKIYFENPNLYPKKLYEMFKEFCREKNVEDSLKLPAYKTYHKFFKRETNYGFSIPKTDICDFCSESKVKLRSNPNDPCKVPYELHLRKYYAYKKMKDDLITKSKHDGSDILVLEFDYAQNLPLPKTNETSQFYKRLMWVYLFNVHCHNNDSSYLYYFLETESKKNPDTVCSFLYDVVQEKFDGFSYKEIYLLSDSAGGQNKNLLVSSFCSWLAIKFNVKVYHLFPARGHSFSVCDRNFGLCGIKIKKEEKVHTLHKYVQLLENSRKNPTPFVVKHAAHILSKWSEGLQTVMSTKPRGNKCVFKIQSYPRLMFLPSGGLAAATSYSGCYTPFVYFKPKDISMDLNLHLPPAVRVQLTDAKEKDVRSLFRFLDEDAVKWYEKVFEDAKIQ